MSKELTPLEALKHIRYLIIFDERLVDIDGDSEPIKVFIDEESPKEYQLIEKSLKALEIIKRELNVDEILFSLKGVASAKDYDVVKEALL